MTAEASSRAAAGEAGFQLLADHLPDLILLAFDPELVMWAATGGALRARGWTPEQFIGLTVPEIVGSTRAEDIDACCRTALAGEIAQLDLDGYDDPSRLWSLHFVPLADAGNAVSGGMVLCRDVTEQRQAEQLLEANRRQLAEAQRIAQVGSWEWDLKNDEVTVSDEFCRIFGLPAGSRWSIATGRCGRSCPAARGSSTTVDGWCGSSGPTRTSPTAAAPTPTAAACSTGSTRPRRARTAGWPPTCTMPTSRAWPRSASSWSRPGCGWGPAARPRSTICSGRSPTTCRPR